MRLEKLNRRQKAIHVLSEVTRAQVRARAVIHSAYPIGADVSWDKGGHIQYGTIVGHSDHGSGDAFRVRNDATGKTYWIDYYWVRGPQA